MFQAKNDPNVTQAEKVREQDFKKQQEKFDKPPQPKLEQQHKFDQQPLVNLQVYEQSKPPPKPSLKQKMETLPHPVNLASVYAPPQVAPMIQGILQDYKQPFIYKDYHINLGPDSNHIMANKVYTDMLPIQNVMIAYKSLKERNYLANHIRSTFINGEEGELVTFSDKKTPVSSSKGTVNCIINRLKLLEQSPFNDNLFSKNPYDTMIQGLLIYRSCYPIEYDSKTNSAVCAKNSVGMNVRIYALTDSDFSIISNKTIKDGKEVSTEVFERTDSLVWREIDYYRYVREEISKDYSCPNFIQSYCYFLNEDVNLNFEKNALMKAVKKYSKYSVVLLTESPNDSLYSWVGNKYQPDPKNPLVQNMIRPGIKKDDEWKSVIFQMLMVFYTMCEHCFVFNNMDTSRNFYIKNISFSSDTNQFWIYNINGIEYYLPNYGYVVLFDTYYCNKSGGNQLSAKFLKDDQKTIRQIIKNNAINVFSVSNYTDLLQKMGGVKPSQTILDLLNSITKSFSGINSTIIDNLSKNFVEDIVLNNFPFYLNNRIGTNLYEGENSYVVGNTKPNKRGDLVLKKSPIDADGKFVYEVALYTCNKDELKCDCITKLEPLKTEEIEKENIYSLVSNDVIKQNFVSTNPSVASTENIIEVYRLNR